MTWRPLGWAAGVVLAVLAAVPSVAATTTAIGTWTFGGRAQAYTGAVRLPALGFPAATMASSSGSNNSIGIQTGASMWFGPTTPPGQVFGSSQNQQYVNLRTSSDASPGTPSTTTYTFAAGTPTGWGLVLGDIDADKIQVTATSPSGAAVPVAGLGFQGSFNMCTVSPKPSGCGTNDSDVPTWDPSTSTLNGSGGDTNGAAGWFRPTVPLRTLTLVFTRTVVPGAPSYQTWFAVRMQDLTGTVTTAAGCDPTRTRVALVGPDGTTLATTTPDATGHYAFTGVAAGSGYTARLDAAPTGCLVSGPASVPVDLSTADATAGFAVVQAPVATGVVHGTVRDTGGNPVDGAVLHLRGAVTERAETGREGDFRLPPVPAGAYTLTLDPPGDLSVVGEPTRHVVVGADGQAPRLDFVVKHPATATVAADQPGQATPQSASSGALPEVGGPSWWVPALGALLALTGAVLVIRRRPLTARRAPPAAPAGTSAPPRSG